MAASAPEPVSPRGTAPHSSLRYLVVWVALLVLTGLTIVVGRMQFGRANLIVALAIAALKATLVALFFMHLWESEGVNRLVFLVSVVFVSLLTLGVLTDFATRLPAALPPGPALFPG
jgi:cytochrome c oxidase subunit IV